ncbi:MAG: diphthine synthase [Vulcanisaeta sp.]|nr:diphthine synthase [Vulcanisaeta sp.]MCG2895087.1 diphthine synthase [Vulcanisaeta sp.]
MDASKPTLYLVGLGLGPGDVTIRAINVIKSVGRVFMEAYTSKAPMDLIKYVVSIRPDIEFLSRSDLEDRSGEILMNELGKGIDVALLVIGDPMIATTHAALAVIARRRGFNVKVINSVSIMCAVLSQLGLSPYKVGPIATITYPRMGVLSMRAYEVLNENLRRGLHTIFLLDIRDDGGFMSAGEAVELLKRMEDNGGLGIINNNLLVIYVARAGWDDQEIAVSTINDVPRLGETPHTLVIPGLLNPVEMDYLVYVLNADRDLVMRHQKWVSELIKKYNNTSG